MLPEDDRMIETCRSVLSLLTFSLRDAPTVYHSRTVRSAYTVFMCFVFI